MAEDVLLVLLVLGQLCAVPRQTSCQSFLESGPSMVAILLAHTHTVCLCMLQCQNMLQCPCCKAITWLSQQAAALVIYSSIAKEYQSECSLCLPHQSATGSIGAHLVAYVACRAQHPAVYPYPQLIQQSTGRPDKGTCQRTVF